MFTSHGVFSLAKSNSKCSAYLFSACFFFLLDYRRSLYETVQLPSQIDALQIQIPILWLAFSLSLRYFLINRISYFNEMQLLVFPSYLAPFLSWRILLSPKAVGDTLQFSSKSFLVLPFTLTFPILLGLIFMEGDSRGYDSFSPHCYAAGWALTVHGRGHFFLHCIAQSPLSSIKWQCMCGTVSELLFCSIGLIAYSSANTTLQL